MSINNWFLVVSEWVKNLFNMNKRKDLEDLMLLEKVIDNPKLNFQEIHKRKCMNIFWMAKLNGEKNLEAIKQALWCASGENLGLYDKAIKMYVSMNKTLSVKLAPKKIVKRSTRLDPKIRIRPASPKHVAKKKDKPKEAKKIEKSKPETKSKNIDSETPNRDNKWRGGIRILLIALLIVVVIVVIIASCKSQPAAVVVNETTTTAAKTTTAPETTATTTTAPTTWEMIVGDHGNNRWFTDGIVEIKTAKTDADAVKAAFVWLDKIKRDPNLLVAVSKYFLARDVDKASLVDENSWATDKAVQLVAELELVLGQAKVTVEKAPKNGYNTGVENDTVVVAKIAIISGDRTGIKIDITLPDGKVVSIFVMARCGNIVTEDKSELPIGKTDQEVPPSTTTTTTPPATTTTTTPETTTTLAPKSDNPNDYQAPEDKPLVPEVTTPPESTPVVVITIEIVNGVTETPTNDPGSESGVSAPGATPTETTSVPATEAGVNPVDNGVINTGDPGNPF